MQSVFFWPCLQISFLLLLRQIVIKALFMRWKAGKICVHLAEILCQNGGCVSGTIIEAQNLLTYIRQEAKDGFVEEKLTNSGIHLDLGFFKPQFFYVNTTTNSLHWMGIG